MSIEERVAKILTAHFWIEHRMECACGDNGGKRPWAAYSADHVAHVAQVLATELKLSEEWAQRIHTEELPEPLVIECDDEDHARRTVANADKRSYEVRLVNRYVTPWENA